MEEGNAVVIGVILAWFAMAIGVFVLADRKGRNGLGYFLLAVLLSPFIALIIVMALPSTEAALEARALKSGELKRCENCGAISRELTYKCDSCGQSFPKIQAQ